MTIGNWRSKTAERVFVTERFVQWSQCDVSMLVFGATEALRE